MTTYSSINGIDIVTSIDIVVYILWYRYSGIDIVI